MKGKELEGTACSKAKEHRPFVCFTCTMCMCVCVVGLGTGRKSGTLDQGEETENSMGMIQRWVVKRITHILCITKGKKNQMRYVCWQQHD